MRFFVYGMLKSNQPKAWMIPFSISKPYVLKNFKMYLRPNGTAGMIQGTVNDQVIGEIREVKWDKLPIIGKPLSKLLLYLLDLNEGTDIGIYKRAKISRRSAEPYNMWTYIFNGPTDTYKVIEKWEKEERR